MGQTFKGRIKPSKNKIRIKKSVFYALIAVAILALLILVLVKTGVFNSKKSFVGIDANDFFKAKLEYKYCGCASSVEIYCCTEMDFKGECQKSPCQNGCIGMENKAACLP